MLELHGTPFFFKRRMRVKSRSARYDTFDLTGFDRADEFPVILVLNRTRWP